MQKRATCNTSQPGIEEVSGGSKENDDISLLFAALRELLVENGVLILNAKPLGCPYFYYWRHKNRTTGKYKWLIKFIFLFLVTNRMWNSDKQRPEGNRLILIDPEEVSDTFSIKESQMNDMRVWDP
ncbi:hypothetical protein BDV33DRAFT_185334 [Aspergillus novoparasiticus]|uniref:Uncharacterized protein n=1 Tax=Aspergillus novoparasiticus TaxID=986946 RepID=A0A5N6E8M3_9EURO|nr:hypothetical protein BDV33DRAFT_185334 [Aspergillus novoparasiticus]